jgi:hypothetical protein
MSARNKVVSVKLTQVEYDQLDGDVKARGTSKAELFRDAWGRDRDQLHAFKAMDKRLARIEEKIDGLLPDPSHLQNQFDNLAKKDKAIYLVIKELIGIVKAGGER